MFFMLEGVFAAAETATPNRRGLCSRFSGFMGGLCKGFTRIFTTKKDTHVGVLTAGQTPVAAMEYLVEKDKYYFKPRSNIFSRKITIRVVRLGLKPGHETDMVTKLMQDFFKKLSENIFICF